MSLRILDFLFVDVDKIFFNEKRNIFNQQSLKNLLTYLSLHLIGVPFGILFIPASCCLMHFYLI